jgi:hypothetical protein
MNWAIVREMAFVVVGILVGCAVFTLAEADPITDTEVEQARYTHVLNTCIHELQLKGHTVPVTLERCRKVAREDLK